MDMGIVGIAVSKTMVPETPKKNIIFAF